MKSSDKEVKKFSVDDRKHIFPKLTLLYQDNHLLLISKPGGLLSQSNETQEPSAESWIRHFLAESEGKQNPYLTPVFRIDKAVSGLLLFARSSKAAGRLQGQEKKLLLRKGYLAKIEGHLPEQEGLLEDFLLHGSHRAEDGSFDDPQAKFSLLAYRTLLESATSSLLEIDLLTGRYHQIRFQLARRGFPIWGDQKYGSRHACPSIALHHFHLVIIHPVTHKTLTFFDEPPFVR